MANKIKFLKHGLRYQGKYIKAFYSDGELRNAPKGTISIYATDYGVQLPRFLKPKNDTEFQTDYFSKDIARIRPKSKYYPAVKNIVEENRKKRNAKIPKPYDWGW